jgi:hypothetical protein
MRRTWTIAPAGVAAESGGRMISVSADAIAAIAALS